MEGEFEIFITLAQESVAWFDSLDASNAVPQRQNWFGRITTTRFLLLLGFAEIPGRTHKQPPEDEPVTPERLLSLEASCFNRADRISLK